MKILFILFLLCIQFQYLKAYPASKYNLSFQEFVEYQTILSKAEECTINIIQNQINKGAYSQTNITKYKKTLLEAQGFIQNNECLKNQCPLKFYRDGIDTMSHSIGIGDNKYLNDLKVCFNKINKIYSANYIFGKKSQKYYRISHNTYLTRSMLIIERNFRSNIYNTAHKLKSCQIIALSDFIYNAGETKFKQSAFYHQFKKGIISYTLFLKMLNQYADNVPSIYQQGIKLRVRAIVKQFTSC
jgi:GH24 family phage-related lysozyme (muramidase)